MTRACNIAVTLISLNFLILAPSIASFPIIVDQSVLGSSSDSHSFKLFQLGQEFTPTFSTLDIVELHNFGLANGPGGKPGTIAETQVRIREDSITGAILGESSVVTITPNPGRIEQFLFPKISLSPGNIHVIEVVHVSGDNGAWGRPSLDTYLGHNRIVDGNLSGQDFSFQTGVVGPALGEEAIINGGAETGDTSGWSTSGIEAVPPDPGASGFGDFVFTGGLGPATSQTLLQDVNLSPYADQIDSGQIKSHFNIYLQARGNSGVFDTAEATLSFLDNVGSEIQSVFVEDNFNNEWDLFTDDRVVPVGTRSIQVLLESSRTGGLSSDGFFDEVSLVLAPKLAGDFDCDGDVDGADFLEWQRTDGTSVGLTAWVQTYGGDASSLDGALNVPEPATVALTFLSCLLFGFRHRS